MSRTQVDPMPETVAQLMASPFAEAAREIVERAGVLSFDSDRFLQALEPALEGPEDAEFNASIATLIDRGEHSTALELEQQYTAACGERSDRAYLVGVVVGLRLRGA